MIGPFRGEYRFLSNFYPASVLHRGILFPSVEHAYQAAKTTDLKAAEGIANLSTPGEAKRAGRVLGVRPDWNSAKVGIMRDLLREKFLVQDLRRALLATGDEELVEVNTWGDTFWGQCDGVGENMLGRLLMEVRAELRAKQVDERGFFLPLQRRQK